MGKEKKKSACTEEVAEKTIFFMWSMSLAIITEVSASRIVYSDVRSGKEAPPTTELSFPPVCVWMIRYANDFPCRNKDNVRVTRRHHQSIGVSSYLISGQRDSKGRLVAFKYSMETIMYLLRSPAHWHLRARSHTPLARRWQSPSYRARKFVATCHMKRIDECVSKAHTTMLTSVSISTIFPSQWPRYWWRFVMVDEFVEGIEFDFPKEIFSSAVA